MDSKTDLRIWAKSIRKTLDICAVSSVIADKIRVNNFYKNAENVMLFYPAKYEVNLLSLLDDDKNFYLPKVCGDKILVCPFKKGDQLVVSNFKINEPCSEPVSAQVLDLVLVPALAVDKAGFRLGYGGGFYDRFLPLVPAKTVVPIPHQLYLETLPVEKFDVPVDCVITDN